MKIQKYHLVGIILPVLLLLVVFAMDVQLLSIENLPVVASRFRELVLLVTLAFFMWGISHQNWIKHRSILQKLRFLGIFILLFWGGVKLLEKIAVYSNHFFLIVVLLFVIFISVCIFITLKELIFVQQGKKTERNFRILLIFIFLQMVYVLLDGREIETIPIYWGMRYEQFGLKDFFFAFVVLFAVINGFRCKWIHYLNKKQKVGVFFLGGLTYPIVLSIFSNSYNVAQDSSIVVGSFINCLSIFYIIYSGMALLGILFQLPSAGLMDRRMREIKSLQALSATIGSVFNTEKLVSKTTELSLKVVGADFSWLELKENSTYRLAGTHGIKSEDVEKIPDDVKKTLRKEVSEKGRVLLINNVTRDKRIKKINKWKRKVGSLLAVSIRFKNKELGILYALKRETFGFVEESRSLFQTFADQVGLALENSNLVKVTIEQEVYREELRLAHQAQMRILPKEMPKIKGVDTAAFCITANEIGGDFYDVIVVGKDRVDFVVGDVSGKGASAAFYMAELKGVIQALAPHFSSPKQILIEVNTFLRKHFEPEMFVTMSYGIFLPSNKNIRIVRAGHPPVGLLRKKKVSWLESPGLGLGLTSNDIFAGSLKEKVLSLKKGDALFFYTDGLTEARNKKGEEFGEKRLTEILSSMGEQGAEDTLQDIRHRMETFTHGVPRHDDVTLVVVKILR